MKVFAEARQRTLEQPNQERAEQARSQRRQVGEAIRYL